MNIKVLLAFVTGVVIASGVAFYAVRQNQRPDQAAASSTAAPAPGATQAAQTQPPAQAMPLEPAPALPAEQAAPAVVEKPSPAVGQKQRRETPKQVARVHEPSAPAASAPPSSEARVSPAPAPPPPQSATPAPAAPPEPAAQTPPPAPVRDDPPPPPPRQPQTVTIPAGTLVNVRLGEGLSSDRNAPGDTFTATLDQPLVVDGAVIAERGARAEGRVVESRKAGRVQGVSDLVIELVRLNTSDGQKIRIQTESFTKQGEKETGKDVAKVGAAAGIGAAIGAIAGGGRGAAIGAAVGGAAGTGGVMATRGKPAELRVETRISFRLRDAVTVTEKLR